MMRRARLSVRPNVRPGGRAAGAASAASARDGGSAPAAEPEPGKESKTAAPGENGAEPASGEPAAPRGQEEQAEPIETAASVSHETPARTTSAPLQRRKRISTLPNLIKPRVSNSASAVPPPKPSQVDVPSSLPVTPASCKNEGSSAEKGKVLSPQKSQGHLSPPQGQLVTLPEKRTPVPQVPQFSPYKKSVLKHQDVSPTKPAESAQKEDPSPLKERPSQKSSLNDLYEPVKKTSTKKIINTNLEKERLRRAQKLRDLLKEELRKEQKAWRAKHPISPVVELERSKMTMRDFIHFIPMNNPMSASLEENSRISEKSSPVDPPVMGFGGKSNAEDEDLDDDEDDNDEEDDSQLLAPRVKVAEDGSIILDEESLTVEVTRNKAPIVEGNDPIFERGSTTTYTSFRKNIYSKPWSNQETDLFFLAISMVGTDFSMISHLFPHRKRIEIKNKFKREERVNGWRIDKAFREKSDFDFEFFAQLLEQALEQGKQKKTRTRQPRKASSKPRQKQKDKTAAEQILCDEESVISEEEGADTGTAEKENKRSLVADECSGAADPLKKKKAKRKKDNTKKPEEENRESQDDDLTRMPKKKPRKSKTPAPDTDNQSELHSVDGDGNPKETLAEKKTRVQKKKPNYEETVTEEDDENDGDFEMIENPEVADAHESCNAGEADLSSQCAARTCEEESSLGLFTDESDIQSGLDDLSGIQHSLNEVNEAVLQTSDVYRVASNIILGETEAINVAQEETSSLAIKFDHSDKVDATSGQLGEQDTEPKDKQEKTQVRKVRPAPNLSRAKKKVYAEEQSDQPADDNKDSDVEKDGDKVQEKCINVEEQKEADEVEKQKMPQECGARPSPKLSAATLKKEMSTEEQRDTPEDHSTPIDDGKGNNKVKEECFSVGEQKQADKIEKAEDSSTAPNEEKVSSIKPALLGRGRFQRPKPNLPARISTRREKLDVPKPTDVLMEGTENPAEKADVLPQIKREDTANVDSGEVGLPLVDQHSPDCSSNGQKDVGSEPAQAEESNPVQQDSDKETSSTEKPALHVRGCLRPKPNLTKTTAQKSKDPEQRSEHPQVSREVSHVGNKSPSQAPDGDQESEVKERVEASSRSQDECAKSSIKPAALVRGRFQRPKPNLMKATPRKGALENKEDLSAPSTGHAEGLTGGDVPCDDHSGKQENEIKDVGSGSSQDSCKSEINPCSLSLTQDSPVNQDSLTEESSASKTQDNKSHIKPAPLIRGRSQKPKPNLARLSARKADIDIKERESLETSSGEKAEKTPASDETKSSGAENSHGNETGAASLQAERNEKSSVIEEDSNTLEKPDNGACPGTSVGSTPAINDKEQSVSDGERKTVKPGFTRGRLQRPKPNLSKSTPRSAMTATPVSSVREETRPGTTDTGNDGSNISLDAKVLSDAENKSSVNDACDGAPDKVPAQPKEAVTDIEKGKAASLKPIGTRFAKPIPNLSRAAVRKETSTREVSKQDLPDTSTADHVCKDAGHTSEDKSATIKPAQLKRVGLVRPVPNLVKPSTKTSSPLKRKRNEDLNGAAADKDKGNAGEISSPTKKKTKASDCNVDVSPKRICPSGRAQKPSCFLDSEVDQPSLTDEPQSSSQTSHMQDPTSSQRSRFGRSVRKLSTPPSASPKSENASDHPEKEKAARNVKSSTTKVSKPVTTKSKGKTTLVKLRASQQEDDEDEDMDLGFEDENYDLSPDMQNQAPVFIPFHLRSPKPVPAEIEETVEELEIPMDLENGTSQDLERFLFQNVVDPQVPSDKKDQCDGSAEAAMTLISMGSSVYKTSIEEFLIPDQCTESDPSGIGEQSNQGPLTSPVLPSSPSSPPDNICAFENSVTIDPRIEDVPHCAPNPENDPIQDSFAFPVHQMSYPIVEGDTDSLQQEFSSQHVSVSECLLGEQDTGGEATFILTLVEIPINNDYAYSCDSSVSESLPAPVFISTGSSQELTQNLNSSVEAVSHEPPTVSQEDQDQKLGQTSRKGSTECIDDADLPPLPKKPSVSEVIDPKLKTEAVEGDGDENVAPEVSDTEAIPEEAAGGSPTSSTTVMEGPPNWSATRTANTVPVEMPGISMTDPLNRNLPVAYTNPVTTSKTTLKRPGRKPLGFLSLVCKEKQLKKTKEENRKKKILPKTKCKKISPTISDRQKKSQDLTLENANDGEVPSSSATLSPAEMQSTTTEQALPSVPQIPDNQDIEEQSPSKSHELASEEEAAPVSEYFFGDIFMEVDD
ncbi:transcription factor TFIIIB component B'' homolog isoform 2-T4 [Anomaloglossus baeobatrachus]|uniref:transcription factor TFIIIB component B'' homolog isoform X2 n=1 Tax=Anomaloglossus baeobatrachus TaxID=238106 RepID=UPI003F5007AA